MRIGLALAFAAAVAVPRPSAAAVAVQELLKNAGPSVAHLSLRGASGKEVGSGSGFVIAPDGQVATNFHVIEGASRIVATFPDRKPVEVVGIRAADEKADLAILQLAPGTYPPLVLATIPAKQGDEIVVIGSPLGLSAAISPGIVAAVRERGTVTEWDKDGMESWGLQVTASMAPGSSGSPILDADGRVVGLAVGLHWGGPLYFGVPVARLQSLLATPQARGGAVKPLAAKAPVDPRVRNLLVSAAFFAALAVLWWLGFHRSGRRITGGRVARG